MPYIKKEGRVFLDNCIEDVIFKLTEGNSLTNEEFLSVCGEINYTFSRILSGCMGDVSYSKIATATGVLENIKQEFYRRVASTYEDKKQQENGDILEYSKLN